MSSINAKKKRFSVAWMDIFAPNISLTFDGKQQYKTEFGGAVSILTFAIILTISIVKIQSILFGYDTAEFFTTKKIYDVNEPLDLKQLGFSFAV